jgi:MFS family permease
MAGFTQLLRQNPNYRNLWFGQVVSEVGDHFNTIAVFSLVLHNTNSGFAVSGVMLARAIPMLLAGPLAGVALDRLDRRKLMLWSDLFRAAISILFMLAIPTGRTWLVYLLSALLMGASPFFTSGRTSILPAIASKQELHTANTMTQTTQWTTTAVGSFLGGASAAAYGYEAAFFLNAVSFLFSAWSVSLLKGEFTARREHSLNETKVMKPWKEYVEGLRYIASIPLVFGIMMVGVGWASGGGAAQVLFSLFGERVFQRGPAGIGELWGVAGLGLVIGGFCAHRLMPRLSFAAYKRTIALAYLFHGGCYIVFSLMTSYGWALFFLSMSRAAVAFSSVMNMTLLLRHVTDEYRGRVFATLETLVWAVMMLSMTGAGLASDRIDTRWIGVASGALSSCTAFYWIWANATNRLPEPILPPHAIAVEDLEVHGEPAA